MFVSVCSAHCNKNENKIGSNNFIFPKYVSSMYVILFKIKRFANGICFYYLVVIEGKRCVGRKGAMWIGIIESKEACWIFHLSAFASCKWAFNFVSRVCKSSAWAFSNFCLSSNSFFNFFYVIFFFCWGSRNTPAREY